MAKYTGKTFTINRPAQEIADKFSDLTSLQAMIDKLPEEEKGKVQGVSFTTDSVLLQTPQLGQVSFTVVTRTPEKVVMKASGTPVPMNLEVAFQPNGADATDATCGIDIQLPAMLSSFIGPQINKAVGMLSDMMQKSLS
ncbi:MAG: hypothetical protein NC102_09915 [Clostridium sp.]|nr:hypothetical protein [Clostridium sp.]